MSERTNFFNRLALAHHLFIGSDVMKRVGDLPALCNTSMDIEQLVKGKATLDSVRGMRVLDVIREHADVGVSPVTLLPEEWELYADASSSDAAAHAMNFLAEGTILRGALAIARAALTVAEDSGETARLRHAENACPEGVTESLVSAVSEMACNRVEHALSTRFLTAFPKCGLADSEPRAKMRSVVAAGISGVFAPAPRAAEVPRG